MFWRTKKLEVGQITGAESHVNKFAHLQVIVDKVKPTSVLFLTICRKRNFEGFIAIDKDLTPKLLNVVQMGKVWYKELADYVDNSAFLEPAKKKQKKKEKK